VRHDARLSRYSVQQREHRVPVNSGVMMQVFFVDVHPTPHARRLCSRFSLSHARPTRSSLTLSSGCILHRPRGSWDCPSAPPLRRPRRQR
jgi:hypothetical protein